MRTSTGPLVLALLLAGCTTATAKVGLDDDTTGSGGQGVEGGGGGEDSTRPDTTDTADHEDTGDTVIEEPPFAFIGEYVGDMTVSLSSDWGAYDFAECAMTATVDEDGGLTGEAACDLAWGGGGGGGGSYTYPFAGSVSDEGGVKASMEVDLGQTVVLDMVGEIDDRGEMVLEVTGEVTDWRTELYGEAALSRE